MKILNIGGGDRPLSKIDLNVTDGFVINYDPGVQLDQIEQYPYRQLGDGAIFFDYFDGNVAPNDIVYFSGMRSMNAYFQQSAFDLILGISPYGFHVVNKDTDPFLRAGGKVLVIGNSQNLWLEARYTDDDVPGIFAPGLIHGYSPYTIPDDHANPFKLMSERILAEYVSFTTAQAQGGGAVLRRTPLNAVRSFTKNNGQ